MLIKDQDFAEVSGEVCKLVEFKPDAKIVDGKIKDAGLTKPYAHIIVRCRKVKEDMDWAITHQKDFKQLWEANELLNTKFADLLVIWSIKKYSFLVKFLYKYFHGYFPKLTIWICPKGSYEKINKLVPTKSGEAGFLEVKPLREWKPFDNELLV